MAGEKFPIPSGESSPDLERELEALKSKLREEVEAIKHQSPFLGEGRVAKVFDLGTPFHDTTFCVKLYRPDIAHLSPYTRQTIQPLDPAGESELQDELFRAGLRVPQPIVFDHIGEQPFFVMEKIPGYTLAQINDHGGLIVRPSWSELEKMTAFLNNTLHVIHRDLHLGNIMLKTKQSLKEAGEALEGELYFIDFGTAKRTFSQPADEDYRLTIGNDVIKYISDRSSINMLEPLRSGVRGPSPFLYR